MGDTLYEYMRRAMEDIEPLATCPEELGSKFHNEIYNIVKDILYSMKQANPDKETLYLTLKGSPTGPEKTYMTMFVWKQDRWMSDEVDVIMDFLLDCIDGIGPLKHYEKDGDSLEIWYGNQLYKLFDYTWGVIE